MAVKIAVVTFDSSSKQYHFLTDLKLQQGDKVVVDTRHGISIATFKAYTLDASRNDYKWIIQKIELNKHEERVKIEAELKKLERQIDNQIKQMDKMELYQILAYHNGLIKQLVEKYITTGLRL